MKRWLLRLLLLGFVPWFVVTQTGAAEAAGDVYSTPVVGSFGYNGPLPGDASSCSFSAYWHASTDPLTGGDAIPNLIVDGICRDQALFDYPDAGYGELEFTGSGCGLPVMSFDPQESWHSEKPGNYFCTISQYCWDFYPGGNHAGAQGCAAIGLGLPPHAGGSTGTCAWAVNGMGLPSVSGTMPDGSGAALKVQVTWRSNAGPIPTRDWSFYVIDDRGNNYWLSLATPLVVPAGWIRDAPAWGNGNNAGAGETLYARYARVSDPGDSGFGDPINIVGIGMFEGNVNGTTAWGAVPTAASGTGSTGRLGVNDPANCKWYWGTKLTDIAGSEIDEPASELDGSVAPPTNVPPDPAESDGDCGGGFDWNEPSTWADGGMCMVVGALVGVIDAIGDMLGALGQLIEAIGNLLAELGELLEFLFVPDPSSWDIDGLHDQLETKPPFSVFASATGGVTSAAESFGGGCTGDLYTIDVGDTDAHVLPCGGPNLPGWGAVYGLANLGLVITTGLVLWNIFAGAIRSRG